MPSFIKRIFFGKSDKDSGKLGGNADPAVGAEDDALKQRHREPSVNTDVVSQTHEGKKIKKKLSSKFLGLGKNKENESYQRNSPPSSPSAPPKTTVSKPTLVDDNNCRDNRSVSFNDDEHKQDDPGVESAAVDSSRSPIQHIHQGKSETLPVSGEELDVRRSVARESIGSVDPSAPLPHKPRLSGRPGVPLPSLGGSPAMQRAKTMLRHQDHTADQPPPPPPTTTVVASPKTPVFSRAKLRHTAKEGGGGEKHQQQGPSPGYGRTLLKQTSHGNRLLSVQQHPEKQEVGQSSPNIQQHKALQRVREETRALRRASSVRNIGLTDEREKVQNTTATDEKNKDRVRGERATMQRIFSSRPSSSLDVSIDGSEAVKTPSSFTARASGLLASNGGAPSPHPAASTALSSAVRAQAGSRKSLRQPSNDDVSDISSISGNSAYVLSRPSQLKVPVAPRRNSARQSTTISSSVSQSASADIPESPPDSSASVPTLPPDSSPPTESDEVVSAEERLRQEEEMKRWKILPAGPHGVKVSYVRRLFKYVGVEDDNLSTYSEKSKETDITEPVSVINGSLGAELLQLIESNRGVKPPTVEAKPVPVEDMESTECDDPGEFDGELQTRRPFSGKSDDCSEEGSSSSSGSMDEEECLRRIAALPGIEEHTDKQLLEMTAAGGKNINVVFGGTSKSAKEAARLIAKAKKHAAKREREEKSKPVSEEEEFETVSRAIRESINPQHDSRRTVMGSLLSTMVPLRIGMDEEWKRNDEAINKRGRGQNQQQDGGAKHSRRMTGDMTQVDLRFLLREDRGDGDEVVGTDHFQGHVKEENNDMIRSYSRSKPRRPVSQLKFREKIWARAADHMTLSFNSAGDSGMSDLKGVAEKMGSELLEKEFGQYKDKGMYAVE